MSESDLFDSLKVRYCPPLSPTLVTALLFDYDPADPSSLEQVKSNLQILADEAIPAFLSSADAQWDEDEEVRKALEEWSLNGGGWTFSETSSGSDDSSSFSTAPTSVDEGDDPSLEFLISLFPHIPTRDLQNALLSTSDRQDVGEALETILTLEAIREAEEAGAFDAGDDEFPSGWDSADETPWTLSGSQVVAAVAIADSDAVKAKVKPPKGKGKSKATEEKAQVTGKAKTPGLLPVSMLATGDQGRGRASAQKSTPPAWKTVPARSTPVSSAPASRSGSVSPSSRAPSPSRATALPRTVAPPLAPALAVLSQTLSDLLPPATPDHFAHFLADPAFPTPLAAIFTSLILLGPETPRKKGVNHPNFQRVMEMLFADDEGDVWEEHREEVALVLDAAGGRISAALDVWNALQEVKTWDQKPPSPQTRSSPSTTPTTSPRMKTGKLPPSPSMHRSLPSAYDVVHAPPPGSIASSSSNFVHGSAAPSSSARPRTAINKHLAPTSSKLPLGPSNGHQPASQKAHNRQNKWNPTTKEAKKAAGPAHPLADSIPAYVKMKKTRDGYEMDRREDAARLARNEAYRTAARHWKSGNASNRGGEVAAFYADQARKLQETTRVIALESARANLEKQNKLTSTMVDLHGLTLHQALIVTSEGINTWYNYRTTTPPTTPFTVITGVGHHSVGHVPILNPAVVRMLREGGWRFSRGGDQSGVIYVHGRL